MIEQKPDSLDSQQGGDHYKHLKIEPIQYAMANGLDACEFSAIKYITRHRFKNGAEDLKKALHFIQIELELLYDCKVHIDTSVSIK